MSSYKYIWCVDFEYKADGEDILEVHCLVARDLVTGRVIRTWEFGAEPPYDIGSDSLFVAHYAAAEFACHLKLGWQQPKNTLCTFSEFKVVRPYSRGSLLEALRAFGIDSIKDEQKYDVPQFSRSPG